MNTYPADYHILLSECYLQRRRNKARWSIYTQKCKICKFSDENMILFFYFVYYLSQILWSGTPGFSIHGPILPKVHKWHWSFHSLSPKRELLCQNARVNKLKYGGIFSTRETWLRDLESTTFFARLYPSMSLTHQIRLYRLKLLLGFQTWHQPKCILSRKTFLVVS